MYDGTTLGWVKMHACCPKCVDALERQKKKTADSLLLVSKKEAMNKVVNELPAWTLPPSDKPDVVVAEAGKRGKEQEE
jgi:hypothetical protein